MGRWTAPRFAHTDTDACQQQLHVILGKAADSRHEAPQEYRASYDITAIGAVCPSRDGNAGGDIKNGKGKAREQSQLPI